MARELTPLEVAMDKLEELKNTNEVLSTHEYGYNEAIDDCIDELIKLNISLERR
jgi:hypothetical protein